VVRKGEYGSYDGGRKETFINIAQQWKEQLRGDTYRIVQGGSQERIRTAENGSLENERG
jgi:hypothetical protein